MAHDQNWDILTVVPNVMNSWTLDCLLDTGFKEVGSLEIFWGSQHALIWEEPSSSTNEQQQEKDKDKLALSIVAAAALSAMAADTKKPDHESTGESAQAGASRRSGTRFRRA
jgi:hypothetical protein